MSCAGVFCATSESLTVRDMDVNVARRRWWRYGSGLTTLHLILAKRPRSDRLRQLWRA